MALEFFNANVLSGSTLGLAKSIVRHMWKTRKMESIHLALKVSLKMDWKAVQYIQFSSFIITVCLLLRWDMHKGDVSFLFSQIEKY